MTCLGELHLELCLKMLVEKFSCCEVNSSDPLVVFRDPVPTATSVTGKQAAKTAATKAKAQAGLHNSEILCPPE